MHDLDPQDQPQQCGKPPVEPGLAKSRKPADRGPGRFASQEEEADLSALDDEALATEAKREALRDQRQERQMRRTEGMLEIGKHVALVALLIFAAVGSMAVAISGLVDHNADIAKAGLLALCAISGGAIYQLGLKAGPADSPARCEGGKR